MERDYETELWLAIDEGLVDREGARALREEAARLRRSPLELLRERGVLSEETLASLRGVAPAAPSPPPAMGPDAEETRTIAPARGGTPPAPRPPEAQAFPLPGWERYQPLRFLGQGGMGRVFLAWDPRLHRHVALKFVRDEDAALTHRFVSEARAQARVKHERVCQVYEVGHVEGRVFIAMQYIDGEPLGALVRSLTVEQKALVLREAAWGVHEAHRVGLIHRDIKPSNILVERGGEGSLRPYVMDFGLAREVHGSITASGSVLGTPHFMAPEQARGEVRGLDRRADIYSLGATLYFLLTGEVPIPGANGLEVLSHIATEEPKAPRQLVPGLPADLEAITLKCLEKDRADRYDSARALAEDLERFLAGEPVRARAGVGYALRKRLRKHWVRASLGAAALLAVTVALGWGAWSRREASTRERLVQRFTEQVELIESRAHYSALSRLHDVREDRRDLQARLAGLEAEVERAGPAALGPGQYALGRGHLALGDEARALGLLQAAWDQGFQSPRVAYALALASGRRYQQQLVEAQRLRTPEQREAATRDAERLYREPALAWLKRSEGAQVASAEYVAARVAFYDGRSDEALRLLEGAGRGQPWFHEVPLLRGDILEARAFQRWNGGDLEGARKDFEAGRQAFAAAAATAESEPAVYRSQAGLELAAMVMELYGKGDVQPSYHRALDALSRCLVVLPDDAACLLRLARVHHRLAEHQLTQGAEGTQTLEKALDAARRALAVAPTGTEATLTLARATWLQARYRVERGEDPRELLGQAAALFERIPEAERDRAYHGDSGLVFKTWADHEDSLGVDSQGHRDQAIRAYEAAIARDPRIPEDHINLGSALVARASLPRGPQADQDLERALTALERARALNPQHVVPYFYAGQAHEQLARRKRNRGERMGPPLEQALEQYRRGLAINPRIPNLHNGMGVALLLRAEEAWDQGGDPFSVLDEARACFEKAITVAPGQGFAYANLGALLIRRSQYLLARGEDPRPAGREAVKVLGQGLERMPGATWLRGLKGTVHVLQARFELERGRDPGGELSRAQQELQAALEKNGNDAETWLQLGKVRELQARWKAGRRSLSPGGLEEAAGCFEKALILAPEELDYRLEAGLFYLRGIEPRGQSGARDDPWIQRGLALAEQVLEKRPGLPVARALRSTLRLRAEQGIHPEALRELAAALAANPNLAHDWSGPLDAERRSGTSP
ncbi:serine/threonine-protein kinase [Corallococcus carmarthensis]|uniref:Serine/threonine-protein kinase n=2 Tax=Corallococcus carmarthensis TaxID=2316728 RepID=A0A3A8JJ82_9BACT|nr:serine/threonine-protein kinase [Corallococcus carmarthensis]RKG95028.1 serine/threonine-protein kinase [Corallococcus carmarthensis]